MHTNAFMGKCRVVVLSSVGLVFVLPADAQMLGGVPYTNSWVGNTHGLPSEHIAHNIDNLYVTPSGKVATITSWDEGGANAALYDGDGAKIGIPEESGTGSWGRSSGEAVFVDESYLYQSMQQDSGYDDDGVRYPLPSTSWNCIRRYHHDGRSAPFAGGKGYDGSMLVIHTGSGPDSAATFGVVVLDGKLYVSDPNSARVSLYDATTIDAIPLRSLAVGNAGLIDHNYLGVRRFLRLQVSAS